MTDQLTLDTDAAAAVDEHLPAPRYNTASALIGRLERWLMPQNLGGIFVSEVGVNGDSGGSQRCDALFAGFTSSSGRILSGYEVKVSRADWRHELAQPHKADMWADACHSWWVVAPSVSVVEPETVPAGWGLLVPSSRGTVRFDVVVKADRKPQDWAPPWWAVRSLMARADTVQRNRRHRDVDNEVIARTDAIRRTFEVEAERRGEQRNTPEAKRALDVVRAFAAAGVALGLHRIASEQVICPPDLDGLQTVLRSNGDTASKLAALAGRWSGVEAVVKAARELEKQVRSLRDTAAAAPE